MTFYRKITGYIKNINILILFCIMIFMKDKEKTLAKFWFTLKVLYFNEYIFKIQHVVWYLTFVIAFIFFQKKVLFWLEIFFNLYNNKKVKY